jgi:hypothetical protein
MYDLRAADGPSLVGVIALGVPMSNQVLTKPFPGLLPNVQSVELQRVILLDSVLANGESWFGAEVFRLIAARDVRGVVTFADLMLARETVSPIMVGVTCPRRSSTCITPGLTWLTADQLWRSTAPKSFGGLEYHPASRSYSARTARTTCT